MHPDVSSPPRFHPLIGATVAVVVAGFWTYRTEAAVWALSFFALAMGLLILAAFFPRLYAPVQRVLEACGSGIARVVTVGLLGSVFVLIFIPGRIVLALRGTDPMKRRFEPAARSYWQTGKAAGARPRYDRQF